MCSFRCTHRAHGTLWAHGTHRAIGHTAEIPRDHARPPAISDVNQHFESLWALYPVKRGKKRVSARTKRALYNVSREDMATAIDTTDLKGQGLPFQLEEIPF